ncbi:MAG: hypothetical protein LKK00_01730 [Intestinimonas sp.]|nr:hypothetical protein [Intestinimonas sp.]
MKIRVLEELPVEPFNRPKVGGVYEVVESEPRQYGGTLYFIEIKGVKVGVFARECEVIRETATGWNV